MPSQPVLTIFSGSIIVLWVGLRLLKKSGQTFSRRALLNILLGGIMLTAISLLNHTNRLSGTVSLNAYGWPHFYLQHLNPLTKIDISSWHFSWGPLASYVWVNIVFYFSLIVFVIGSMKYFRRAENKTSTKQ